MSQWLPPEITTHVQDALARLLIQYNADRAPKLRAMISAHGARWQEIENAFWQVLTESTLPYAIGHQLDVIGKLLGLTRNGNDDDTYRGYLWIRVAELNSQGTAEELISIFKKLTNADSVLFTEPSTACFFMEAVVGGFAFPVTDDMIYQAILTAKPAGVEMLLITEDEDYFGFLEDPEADTFGDVNDASVGGFMPALII